MLGWVVLESGVLVVVLSPPQATRAMVRTRAMMTARILFILISLLDLVPPLSESSFRLCRPWTKLRKIMFVLLIAAIIFSCFFMRWWFRLATPELSSLLVLATFGLLSAPLIDWLYKLMGRAILALGRRKGKKAT